jgi:hypothetical protein
MSLTSPLGLMRHVRRPNLRLEVVPWLNVLAVGWMLSLLQSSYIYAPGLTVALDARAAAPAALNLPVTDSAKLPGRRIDATLTVEPSSADIEKKIFYLDNGIHHYADLPAALKSIADRLKKQSSGQPVLLLLAPADIQGDTFAKLCGMANAAGFGMIQFAVRPALNASDAATGAPGAITP